MKSSTGGALVEKELHDTSYLEAHPEACELFRRLDATGFARSSKVTIRVSQRHLMKENETLRQTSIKIGSTLDQLAIKYEFVQHKNQKLLKKNNRLQDINKVLKFNLDHKKLKHKSHLRLDTLVEVSIDFK